ncbi:MAG: D-alanyl-D-alanine carboxypeptidase family protein [Rhodospirillaceae bacterium]
MTALSQAARADTIYTEAREAILVDAATGAVLFSKSGDEPMPPASMSKMMSVYMVFSRLKEGSLSLDETLPVSENAWRKGGAKSGGSTMFLKPGSRVKVEDLLRGIIVQSGNDACIVIAEALAGSETAFAEAMTAKARSIGMTNSTFVNSTGWPDPNHRTTAKDLAILANRTIQDFPELYHFYSEQAFEFNGIRQFNRNPLLGRSPGADGLKTGHTKEAGFGLTASAKRGDRRLTLVINGLPSKKARMEEPLRLIDWGFREFNNYALFKAGEVIDTVSVWLGTNATVPLIVKDPLFLTLSRKDRAGMKVTATYQKPIPAPIAAGQKVGTVTFTFPRREAIVVPLIAGDEVSQLGAFSRVISAVRYIIFGES